MRNVQLTTTIRERHQAWCSLMTAPATKGARLRHYRAGWGGLMAVCATTIFDDPDGCVEGLRKYADFLDRRRRESIALAEASYRLTRAHWYEVADCAARELQFVRAAHAQCTHAIESSRTRGLEEASWQS